MTYHAGGHPRALGRQPSFDPTAGVQEDDVRVARGGTMGDPHDARTAGAGSGQAHTPGPWKLASRAMRGYRGSVIAVSPKFVAANVAVADLPDNVREHEAEANARLIIAAPDLLDACQELRDALAAAMRVITAHVDRAALIDAFIDETSRLGIRDGIGVRADTVIAQATGQPKADDAVREDSR